MAMTNEQLQVKRDRLIFKLCKMSYAEIAETMLVGELTITDRDAEIDRLRAEIAALQERLPPTGYHDVAEFYRESEANDG